MQPNIYKRARRHLEFRVQDLTIAFLAPYIGAKQLPKSLANLNLCRRISRRGNTKRVESEINVNPIKTYSKKIFYLNLILQDLK